MVISALLIGVAWHVRFESRLNPDRPFLLTLPALVSLYYGLSFGIGTAYFLLRGMSAPIQQGLGYSDRDLLRAAVLGFAGWLCTALGSIAAARGGLGVRRRLSVAWSASEPGMAALLCLYALGWVARIQLYRSGKYFHVAVQQHLVQSTSASSLLTPIALLPLCVLCCAVIQRRKTLIILPLVALEIGWALPTGGRQDLANVAVGLTVAVAIRNRKWPSRPWLALAGLLLLIYFPLVAAYRGNAGEYQLAVGAAAQRALSATASGGVAGAVVSGADSIGERLSDPVSAAVVFAHERSGSSPLRGVHTPEEYFATAWLPRLLLPGKPDPGLYGNEFGRLYGFTSPADYVTSIDLPEPLELYLSLGVLGVLLGSFGIGVGIRAIDALFDLERKTSAAVFSALVVTLLVIPETIPALALVGILKTVLVVGVLFRVTAFMLPVRANTCAG